MSPQLMESLKRFVLPIVAAALLSGIGVWQTSHDGEAALLAFAVALLTPLAAAAGWGAYDGKRAKEGRVQPADVAPRRPGPIRTTGRVVATVQRPDMVIEDEPPPNRPGDWQ